MNAITAPAPYQKPSFFYRSFRNASYQIQRGAAKALSLWENTPKALKIPLEAAAIYTFAPGQWKGLKGALAAITIWAETPKTLSLFLRNHPVSFLGKRWQLFNFSSPNPLEKLTDLDQKISTFERIQPPFFSPSDHFSLSETSPVSKVSEPQEKITDQNLQHLTENISRFSILKMMQKVSGVAEHDATSLFNLVDEASKAKGESIWKIFSKHYSKKMSVWGKIKSFVVYIFLWKIPVLPKTIDAYLKTILKELRIHLKENGEKRTKFINGILEDLDNFFEVFNGATETYANDPNRKGNLNTYRKSAINEMFPPNEETDRKKTPEECRLAFCKKLSASLVDNFCPDVNFDFAGGKLINKILKHFLRNTILPNAFVSLSDEGKEATQRHNIPFFLAITKTLNEQMIKLRQTLESGSSRFTPLTGVKNFEPVVKKFLRAIDLSDCNTAEDVKTKIIALKTPEKRIDATLRYEMQGAIQKGLALLCDYLSKPENTEELFSAVFESVSRPFSGNLPSTEKQWEKMIIEYEGAKILLKQSVASVAKMMVHEAVQDKIRGVAPEQIQKKANKIFKEHQMRGEETLEEIESACQVLVSKINDPTQDIRPELSLIAEALKTFENIERVKISVDQDPPPELATLPQADQEAILRPLLPLYDGANRVMDSLLSLQAAQKNYETRSQSFKILQRIYSLLRETDFTDLKMKELLTLLQELEPYSPTTVKRLREPIDTIIFTIKTWAGKKEMLDALQELSYTSGLIQELVLYVQGHSLPGIKKWKCLEQIKKNIRIAFPESKMQEKLLSLVDLINKYNSLPEPRPDLEKELKSELLSHIFEKKTDLENQRKRQQHLFEQFVSHGRQICDQAEESASRRTQQHLQEMKKEVLSLQKEIAKLKKLIETAKKEMHTPLTSNQLGQIGGTIGFLLGMFLGKYSPAFAVSVGTASIAGILNSKNFVQEKWAKFGTSVLGASAIAGLAVHSGVPQIAAHIPQALKDLPFAAEWASGAAFSLGSGYFWNKIIPKGIAVGVDIAMPKATEVFEKAYEHFLTNDVVIQGLAKLFMKQIIELFPPKK